MPKIKIGDKEYTQDELQGLIGLAEKSEEKIKTLEDKTKKLEAFDDLKSENDKLKAEQYNRTLESRTSEVSKWLEGQEDKDTLLGKIGNMSEDDYKWFKDGKTNDGLKKKKELEEEKIKLEEEKTELQKSKEKAIEEQKKKLNDKKTDPVPATEVLTTSEEDGDEDMGDGSYFKPIEEFKKIYHLDSIGKKYDKKEYQYNNVDAYGKTAYNT